MTQIILNKFEKEKRVIELHLQGKIKRLQKKFICLLEILEE